MKKAIYSFLLFILLIGGCVIAPDPPEDPSVNFDLYITSWEMYYGTIIYNSVDIYYEIVNLGDVDISYYRIRFEVSCTDWSSYYGKSNGLDLIPGETRKGYLIVPIDDKVAQSVFMRVEEINIRTW